MDMEQEQLPERNNSKWLSSTDAAPVDGAMPTMPWCPPNGSADASPAAFGSPAGPAASAASEVMGHWADESSTSGSQAPTPVDASAAFGSPAGPAASAASEVMGHWADESSTSGSHATTPGWEAVAPQTTLGAPNHAELYAEMKLRVRVWKQQNPSRQAIEYPYDPGQLHLTPQDEAALDEEFAQSQEAPHQQAPNSSGEPLDQNATPAIQEQNSTSVIQEQNSTPVTQDLGQQDDPNVGTPQLAAQVEPAAPVLSPVELYRMGFAAGRQSDMGICPAKADGQGEAFYNAGFKAGQKAREEAENSARSHFEPPFTENDNQPDNESPGPQEVPPSPSLVASPEEMHGGGQGSSGGSGSDPEPAANEGTPVTPEEMHGGARGTGSSSPSELPRGTYEMNPPDVGPAVVLPDPVCAESYTLEINPEAIPISTTRIQTPGGTFTVQLKTILSVSIAPPKADPNISLSNDGWKLAAQTTVGEYMQETNINNIGGPTQLSVGTARSGQFTAESVDFTANPPTLSYKYASKSIKFTDSTGAVMTGSLGFNLTLSFEPSSPPKVPFTQELVMIAVGTAAIVGAVALIVAAPAAAAFVLTRVPALVDAAAVGTEVFGAGASAVPAF